MKVLFITNYPSPYRVDFWNLLGQKVDLTVTFTSKPEQQKHRDSSWFNTNYKYFNAVFLTKLKKIGNIEIYIDLIDVIKKQYDIIIFGGYSSFTFMLAMEYLRFHKIPFYIEADGGLISNDNRIKYLIKKHFISAASGWFSSGKVTTDYFIHYGAKREYIYPYPFTCLHHNDLVDHLYDIDISNWQTQREKIRAEAKKELKILEQTVIVYVGQLIYRKGVDTLIKASGRISKNIGVYIVGGIPNDEYIKLQKQYKATNVHFIGFKKPSELAIYYQAADLFVLPTREDIWGLVVNEALSYGLPVISTDKCVAALELVQDSKTGSIIKPNSSKALAETIMKWTKNKRSYNEIEAYKSIQNYTLEKMCDSHFKIFQKILEKKRKM